MVHRRLLRLRVDFKIKIEIFGEKKKVKGKALDINSEGIGFLINEKIPSEKILTLKFTLPGHLRSISSRAKVLVQREVGNAKGGYKYVIGAKFDMKDVKSLERINRFIAKEASFTSTKWLILLLGFVISSHFLIQGVFSSIFSFYSNTSFGNMWTSQVGAFLPFGLQGFLQLVLGVLFMTLCVLFYSHNKHIYYLGCFGLSIIGLIIHSIKILDKLDLFIQTSNTAQIITYQLLILGGFFWMISLLIVKNRRYRSIEESLKTQLEFQ